MLSVTKLTQESPIIYMNSVGDITLNLASSTQRLCHLLCEQLNSSLKVMVMSSCCLTISVRRIITMFDIASEYCTPHSHIWTFPLNFLFRLNYCSDSYKLPQPNERWRDPGRCKIENVAHSTLQTPEFKASDPTC